MSAAPVLLGTCHRGQFAVYADPWSEAVTLIHTTTGHPLPFDDADGTIWTVEGPEEDAWVYEGTTRRWPLVPAAAVAEVA